MQFGKDYYEFCKNKHNFDMKQKGEWQKNYVEYIMSIFPSIKGKKCLDFGCAMGSQTSSFNDVGIDMVGVDVSEYYVNESPFENVKGKLFSYVDKFPFPDQSFDFIHSSQVIEHIPSEKLPSILSELRRVLKEDGVLYLSTCGENEQAGYDEDDPTHCSALSTEKWLKLFGDANFKLYPEISKVWETLPMFLEYKWVQFVFVPIKPVTIPVSSTKKGKK